MFWYALDHLGTPQKMIDADGTVVWSGHYDSFGQCHIDTESAVNNLRFPGQYFDEETGFHYNYMRYYDPRIGRYIRQDPMLFLGGLNLYAYGLNAPGMIMDPMGLCTLVDIGRGAMIEAIAGGIKGGMAGALAGTAFGGVGALPGAAAGFMFGITEGFKSGLITETASAVIGVGAKASVGALNKMGGAADWSRHARMNVADVTFAVGNTYLGAEYPGKGYDVGAELMFESSKALYFLKDELGPYPSGIRSITAALLKNAKNKKDFFKKLPGAVKAALSTVPPHKWEKIFEVADDGWLSIQDVMIKSALNDLLPQRDPKDDFRPLHCEEKVGMDPMGMIFSDPLKPCCD
jgi:RHS repeat-associated protein